MKPLSASEVTERINQGLVNHNSHKPSLTYGKIFFNNIVTLFNFINLILFILIFIAGGEYRNMLFIIAVVCNTLIGIVQELRAKRTIDKISILAAQKVLVLREDGEYKIDAENIVVDDILLIKEGMQILVDGCVLKTVFLEVNESFLTGESEPVRKKDGDSVLSGSFVTSGRAYVKVAAVADNSYSKKIINQAKKYIKNESQIVASLKKIIKWISFIILPLGIALFVSQILRSGDTWQDSVISSSAGVIAMIPEGLILLTSVAFALSVIRIAKHKGVIKDLNGVELLARVDTVCFDKTGTLTTGNLKVFDVILNDNTPLAADNKLTLENIIGNMMYTIKDDNSTARALREFYCTKTFFAASSIIPFSSERKFSAASFDNIGTFVLGAPEYILNSNDDLYKQAAEYTDKGYRVIALAYKNEVTDSSACSIALILLSDTVRSEAGTILKYFKNQNIDVKIISGDNIKTVLNAAAAADFDSKGKILDMSEMPDDCDYNSLCDNKIFARVTPEQKQKLVRVLKENGKTVAMTGDGVNDILALKEADCSVTMANGSSAARDVSNIVLLNSDLSVLPSIIQEGRRVISNIQRVSGLYLTKTLFSMLVCIFYVVLGFVEGTNYPFEPIHLTMISTMFIGIPSFILAFEKNNGVITKKFITSIALVSVPGGIVAAFNVIVIEILTMLSILPSDKNRLPMIIMTGFVCFMALFLACRPMNLKRIVLNILTCSTFISMTFMSTFFKLESFDMITIVIILIMASISILLMRLLKRLIHKA